MKGPLALAIMCLAACKTSSVEPLPFGRVDDQTMAAIRARCPHVLREEQETDPVEPAFGSRDGVRFECDQGGVDPDAWSLKTSYDAHDRSVFGFFLIARVPGTGSFDEWIDHLLASVVDPWLREISPAELRDLYLHPGPNEHWFRKGRNWTLTVSRSPYSVTLQAVVTKTQ
jgi:hypothetical protein